MKSVSLLYGCAYLFIASVIGSTVYGQHSNTINANLNAETNEILVQQQFIYENSSDSTLTELYFNDWNHAYSGKNTALAKRFGDQFKKALHLAKDRNRGFTKNVNLVDSNYKGISWERTKDIDIIRVKLNEPLAPGEKTELFWTYTVKLPNSRFTTYGFGYKKGFYLRDWYLSPAVFDGTWHLYPETNLNDLYTDITQTTLNLVFPEGFYVASNFEHSEVSEFPGGRQTVFKARQQKNCHIILTPEKRFVNHVTSHITLTTDIIEKRYSEVSQVLSINRITDFIHENLGKYPHTNLLVSELSYNKNPLYGINQLPSFIRPYRLQFQFEMKFLKTALYSFVDETLFIDERKERWIHDAIVNYLLIKYADEFYPNQKLAGTLSNLWGVRSYNLAKVGFNEQYYLLQRIPVRRNDDQPLDTPTDSLIFFNNNIANRYKAGLGFSYLGEYIGADKLDASIKEFYANYNLKTKIGTANLQNEIEGKTTEDIDWFFTEYISSRNKIDFKIKRPKKTQDSIYFTIKNKKGTNVPITVFGLQKDSVVSKYWFKDIDTTRRVSIANKGEDKLVLNLDKKIPEINQRDNWKKLNTFIPNNKKFQLRIFRDVENPDYNQIFYVPVANFNVDNGITPGIRISNRTFIERPFQFNITPTYSFREQGLIGGAGFRYRQLYEGRKLNFINYSLGAGTSFFAENSRFTTITPAVTFNWRPENRISNRRQALSVRLRAINRNIDDAVAETIDTEADFSVFNARYADVDNNILKFRSWVADLSVANEFSRVSLEWEYRQLFNNNRQLNLRGFAGAFITNSTNSDFFSFALDRPQDFLFELPFLSRSAQTGFASQQIIIAEGGFKSIFDNRFGNSWIVTGNASFNLWQWIEIFGDIGAIADRGEAPRFVYDSGVRLNLVTDFFELYFPVFSNNGLEIAQPNYEERIRFVVTVSPRTIIRLFTRKWF